MRDADYYTYQFYTWEYRGRGLFVAAEPIQLEPPFIPFFRHRKHPSYIDDGKKHSLVSRFIESFKEATLLPKVDTAELDYETIKPFIYESTERLTALQVRFIKERKISIERMKALLIMLSSYEPSIVSFEIIGTEENIVIQFVSADSVIDIIETYITAYFPDALLQYSDDYLYEIVPETGYTAIYDVGLQQEFFRPLQTAKNASVDPLIGVFAILDNLENGEQCAIQILFQSTGNAWSESIAHSVTMNDGTSFFINDPKAPQLALEKTRSPLFAVSIRLIGASPDIQDAIGIAEQLCKAIAVTTKSEYNQLIPLGEDGYDFATRFVDVQLRESHRLGMLLNIDELLSMLHFPTETIHSKKLFASSRKTVAVPNIATNKAFVIGENEHAGVTKEVATSLEDRVKHMHIIGATGTGKSTLISNLVLQDIEQGIGVVVFDPHGDLINDIIAHVPYNRINDVVLIDPSDTEFPIGLNILRAYTDTEREILSSDLVASFKRFATSWGDQMNTVLGNAIEAILDHPTGSTLHDLRRFLLEKDYREKFLKAVTDPTIRYYWLKEYPLLKTNSVGPILTRLDSFLRPRSIRNMVVQTKSVDFESLLANNRIILCKLSQGLIGIENSFLLGSLLLSKIHQALFRRQQDVQRKPVFLYLDEFQNFITPSIVDMLSGIRKYNVGLILSHQDLRQLQRENSEVLNAVLSNIHIRVAFRVGEPDAKVLQNSFNHFESIDLQNLSRGEAICSIEQPQYDCSITTFPQEVISDNDARQKLNIVIDNSRINYATPKYDVEETFYESLKFDESPTFNNQTHASKNAKDTRSTEELKKERIANEHPTFASSVESKQTVQSETPVLNLNEDKDQKNEQRLHIYIQQLLKQIAESKGYKATIEANTPTNTGKVDVLLEKDNQTIACEISVTTNITWEVHNIEKCLNAQYTLIVMCMHDKKSVARMQQQIAEKFPNEQSKIIVIHSEQIHTIFEQLQIQQEPKHSETQKGYRVQVEFENTDEKDMNKKRTAVGKVILDSIKKMKK